MRRVTNTSIGQQECLRRAAEYTWLAENSRCEAAAAYAFHQARRWRSLALVAEVRGSGEGCEDSPIVPVVFFPSANPKC
jgi:hypothetical protein